jgi:hypothetical protein
MPQTRNVDLHKKTLNFRRGDFEKIEELFPDRQPSVVVRQLVAAFVDKHYERETSTVPVNAKL